jgi:transcriptional regulator with XRE-family HTH domain
LRDGRLVDHNPVVPSKSGPSLRAQWLGQRLRRLREERDLTLRQVADQLERDPSTVSRFESAEYPIRRADLVALLDFFEVHDPHRRQDLLNLREDVWRKGWWEGYADDVEQGFIDYPWLESRAVRILSYDTFALPGLTHTRDYAEATIRQGDKLAPRHERLARLVEMRMTRQRVLEDSDSPTQLTAVLDESALRRPVGGRVVMKAQLRHLLALMDQPNIELRVLPFDVGWHEGFHGAFKLFELPEPYPQVAYVESLAGKLYIETPDVERFRLAHEALLALSADALTSAAIIQTISEEMS